MKAAVDTRAELFSVLQELGDAFPEMRLGQLIVNLAYLAREPSHAATWDAEDEELLAAARDMLANQRQALSAD